MHLSGRMGSGQGEYRVACDTRKNHTIQRGCNDFGDYEEAEQVESQVAYCVKMDSPPSASFKTTTAFIVPTFHMKSISHGILRSARSAYLGDIVFRTMQPQVLGIALFRRLALGNNRWCIVCAQLECTDA